MRGSRAASTSLRPLREVLLKATFAQQVLVQERVSAASILDSY